MGNVGSTPAFSVIIPALNEERSIGDAVRSAKCIDNRCEIIVVDGGSKDSTARNARHAGATSVITTQKGRARQLNAGAAKARGDVLLFLHADSKLPENWELRVQQAMAPANAKTPRQPPSLPPQWGCFESISIDAGPVVSWIVQQGVRLRTLLCHRPYGDQGIFVTRSAYKRSGGYPDWPLLEDLALVKQLKRQNGAPAIVKTPIETSGRRWQALGLVQTTLINQAILLAYAMGTDVHTLAEWYKRDSIENYKKSEES